MSAIKQIMGYLIVGGLAILATLLFIVPGLLVHDTVKDENIFKVIEAKENTKGLKGSTATVEYTVNGSKRKAKDVYIDGQAKAGDLYHGKAPYDESGKPVIYEKIDTGASKIPMMYIGIVVVCLGGVAAGEWLRK